MEQKVYITAGKVKKDERRYHTKFSCVQSLNFTTEYVPLSEALSRGFDIHCIKCQTPKSRKK